MTSDPTHLRPAAVLFDCDGVLADSEPTVNKVVAADLSARGWPLTPDEAGANFLGMALPDMVPLIEAKVGPLPEGWMAYLKERVAETMAREVVPMPGAAEVLATLRAAGIPLALASNSSRLELSAKLGRLGFGDAFEGRVLSFEDVPNPKPQPDIYRAAAAACGADPAACVVVEDSATGARAGVAAGCRVLGFAHVTEPEALIAVGVQAVFTKLAQLPELLGVAAPVAPIPVANARG